MEAFIAFFLMLIYLELRDIRKHLVPKTLAQSAGIKQTDLRKPRPENEP